MVAPYESLARIPAGIKPEDAASLMCAGLTTFNSLRNQGAKPGQVVAVQGVGGLGHYAVQFSRAMGFTTVAISGGADKEKLAKELGAHHYIDSAKQNVVAELKKLGGARVILTTVTDSKAMSSIFEGLSPRGILVVLGADFKPLEISPLQLIHGARRIQGWASGTATDSEETISFAVHGNVKSYLEVFPFEKTLEAYERMLSKKQIFRVVISHTGAKHAPGTPFPRA